MFENAQTTQYYELCSLFNSFRAFMCTFWIEYETGVVIFFVGEPFFVDARKVGSCRSESVAEFILSYFISWQNMHR